MFLFAQETVTVIPPWMQGSVGLMAALMILRAVFTFIDRREGKRQNGNGVAPSWAREPLKVMREVEDNISATRTKVKDLHEWHKPENGVQDWKNRQLIELMGEFKVSVEAAAIRSTTATDNNTRVMERLIPILMSIEK